MALDVAPNEIAALLGRGTRYEGKLTFDGQVRIDGAFTGDVFSHGTLIVGEGAELDGSFNVGTLLVLGGVVSGKVIARELVELHAAAIVHADIETPKLFVDRGAKLYGKCTMGDEAAKEPERHTIETLQESGAWPTDDETDAGHALAGDTTETDLTELEEIDDEDSSPASPEESVDDEASSDEASNDEAPSDEAVAQDETRSAP